MSYNQDEGARLNLAHVIQSTGLERRWKEADEENLRRLAELGQELGRGKEEEGEGQ